MLITNHARYKRAARISEIMATTGLGNQIAEKYDPKRHSWSILTDTGVLMVMDEHKEVLITLFRANINQAIAIYKQGRDGVRMPQKLYNLIISYQH